MAEHMVAECPMCSSGIVPNSVLDGEGSNGVLVTEEEPEVDVAVFDEAAALAEMWRQNMAGSCGANVIFSSDVVEGWLVEEARPLGDYYNTYKEKRSRSESGTVRNYACKDLVPEVALVEDVLGPVYAEAAGGVTGSVVDMTDDLVVDEDGDGGCEPDMLQDSEEEEDEENVAVEGEEVLGERSNFPLPPREWLRSRRAYQKDSKAGKAIEVGRQGRVIVNEEYAAILRSEKLEFIERRNFRIKYDNMFMRAAVTAAASIVADTAAAAAAAAAASAEETGAACEAKVVPTEMPAAALDSVAMKQADMVDEVHVKQDHFVAA